MRDSLSPEHDLSTEELFERVLEDPRHDDDRRGSYAIMGLVGDFGLVDEIRPLLEAHLTDPDEHIRRYCRDALDGRDI